MERIKGKLGFGLMRLPKLEDGIQIDIEQTAKMVDAFMAAGLNYFDTAYIYEQGLSEMAVKEVLVSRYPRESFYLATKLNAHIGCSGEKSAKQELLTSLERTGAGYFDSYLLHGLGDSNYQVYDKYKLWDFVKEQKEAGLIRHYGLSFHGTPALLEKLLNEHPDVEFVQLQINYADWDSKSVGAKTNYEIARKHGLPIVVMEPVKGGLLANPPQQVADIFARADKDASIASWAIRYVASKEGIQTVLSGMSNIEQMENNLSYMTDFKPLSEQEEAVIAEATAALDACQMIPCTGCHYCAGGCPKEINIPDILDIMNLQNTYKDLHTSQHHYFMRTKEGSKASNCIECGRCESACPQNLPIISLLKQAKEILE